jgi:hypothetical protein
MNVHNEMTRDACYSATELLEMMGESDLPSTRPPSNIPLTIYSNFDRLFSLTFEHSIQKSLLAETLHATLYSTDEDHNPEDDLIAMIDARRATHERADITRAWKEREEELRSASRWEPEDLHPMVEVTRSVQPPQHMVHAEVLRLLTEEDWYHLDGDQLRRMAHKKCAEILTWTERVPLRIVIEPQDMDERSEAKKLSRELSHHGKARRIKAWCKRHHIKGAGHDKYIPWRHLRVEKERYLMEVPSEGAEVSALDASLKAEADREYRAELEYREERKEREFQWWLSDEEENESDLPCDLADALFTEGLISHEEWCKAVGIRSNSAA